MSIDLLRYAHGQKLAVSSVAYMFELHFPVRRQTDFIVTNAYKFLDIISRSAYITFVNSNQFKAWLKKQGCTFESKRGTGHIVVRLNDKMTDLPMHGGNKELGKGLVEKIKKQLGLK